MSDIELMIDGKLVLVKDVVKSSPTSVSFTLNDKNYQFDFVHKESSDQIYLQEQIGNQEIKKGQTRRILKVAPYFISSYGDEIVIERPKKIRTKKHHQDMGQMLSPMPGKILKIMVTEGQDVKARDPLLVMEAMKMEHTIFASKDGKIGKIYFKEGDQVSGGVELVDLC